MLASPDPNQIIGRPSLESSRETPKFEASSGPAEIQILPYSTHKFPEGSLRPSFEQIQKSY